MKLCSDGLGAACLLRKHWLVALILAVAAFLLYLPSELCGALAITPDSTEYSVCLANLFEKGTFGFTVNGVMYPSRYAPWFSLTCLSPAYLLTGNPLNCTIMIWVFALILLYAVWRWGRVCGLGQWALAPMLVLMLSPTFVYYSRIVMTEIPYAALTSILGLVFVHFVRDEALSLRFCCGVGLLVAWCGAVRSSGLFLLTPFVVVTWIRRDNFRHFMIRVLVLLVPTIVYLLIAAFYNYCVFGDFFRAGYSYWQSIPYDFPKLLFNWCYIQNVSYALRTYPMFSMTTGGALVLLITEMCKMVGRATRLDHSLGTTLFDDVPYHALVCFFLWHTCVIFAMYCRYFFFDLRFFMPMYTGVVPLLLATFIRYVSRSHTGRWVIPTLTVIVFGLSFHDKDTLLKSYFPVMKRMQYDAIISGTLSAQLPEDAILIPNINPCIAEHFGLGNKHFTMLPFRRIGEYSNRMIATSSIGDAKLLPGRELVRQTFDPTLVKLGRCKYPYPLAISENLDEMKNLLDTGKRLFILPLIIDESDLAELEDAFQRLSLCTQIVGTWETTQIKSNPIRRAYDKIVLTDDAYMGQYPEFPLIVYEILPISKNSQGG